MTRGTPSIAIPCQPSLPWATEARPERHTQQAAHPMAIAAVAMFALLALPSVGLAQIAEGSLMLPAEVEVRGRGWSQLSNYNEMFEFALSLIEAIIATAAIGFHPVNFSYREPNTSFDLPKSMFLFALIGMLTGFLVMHHGYLIGFVIFGIGGLFRFRMETVSTFDTAQLVIVSLVGLAIGLDLPVMAFVSVVATCVVLWIFGKAVTLKLEVKFDEKHADKYTVIALQKQLSEHGFQTISVSKAKFKPIGHFILKTKNAGAQASLVRHMADIQAMEKSGIVDWHID